MMVPLTIASYTMSLVHGHVMNYSLNSFGISNCVLRTSRRPDSYFMSSNFSVYTKQRIDIHLIAAV